MKKDRTKRRFGILLTALLLIQLSYHAIHVLSHHKFDSHTEQIALGSQIDKTSLSCELCAKLLGKTFFLWVFTATLMAIVITKIVLATGGLTNKTYFVAAYLLRGPPNLFK